MVAALGVGRDILGVEQHVAKFSFGEHQRLVGEMRRFGVAALAAAHDGLGANGRPEFHRRDEAVTDRSVDFLCLARVGRVE